MTHVLPRSLDDHVLISRMAKALRPYKSVPNYWLREILYELDDIHIVDAKRLDALAVAAELRRREVFQSKRRDAA